MPKEQFGTHPGKSGTYQIVPTDADLVAIKNFASQGLSQKSIAFKIGISPATLFRWMERHKEVRLAWEQGMAVNDEELSSLAMNIARNHQRKDQLGAVIWLMKVKHGYAEKKEVTLDTTQKSTTAFAVQDISPTDAE